MLDNSVRLPCQLHTKHISYHFTACTAHEELDEAITCIRRSMFNICFYVCKGACKRLGTYTYIGAYGSTKTLTYAY